MEGHWIFGVLLSFTLNVGMQCTKMDILSIKRKKSHAIFILSIILWPSILVLYFTKAGVDSIALQEKSVP